MASVLARKLLVLTGKGGAGKTTIAAAIGLLAASRGLRTIVVEVGDQKRLQAMFGAPESRAGVERRLQDELWSLTIDPDRALLEWLQVLGGRISGRVLATSSTFHYFTAAAPGAKELLTMVKVWELAQSGGRRGGARSYDLVVLDAPATGHALGMLQSPMTFGAIARVGRVAEQAERVRALLADPERSSYLAVAQPAELAVTETLELQSGLRRLLARELETVVVNGVLPRRFTEQELRRLAECKDAVAAHAARAARAVHERARVQHNQIARLRRRDFRVLTVPFQFRAELDLQSLQMIGEHLARRL